MSSPLRHPAFGRAVRFIRDDAKLSQEQVGLRGGIAPTYISNLEMGKANPTLSTLERLAEGLGVDSADILNLARILARKRDG